MDAGKATERASNADERASKNEKEAAILHKRAEDEASARTKLERDLAWRRLNEQERSKLSTSLASFRKQPIGLAYNVSDVESYGFASDIALALKSEWDVLAEPFGIITGREGPVPLGTNPPLERGLIVMSTSDLRSREAADAFVKTLASLGFDVQRAGLQGAFPVMFHRSGPAVFIEVQPRPDGPQGAAKLKTK